MKPPIIGYIVTTPHAALTLGFDVHDKRHPSEGVLYVGGAVTLFPTYEAARQACRRTVSYARRCGYSWDLRHVVRPVRSPGRRPW